MPESDTAAACLAAVVLDTNVLVAAGFHPGSASGRIVDAVRQGRLRLVWNYATRRETEHVLARIPPLRGLAVADLFRPEDRFEAATDPARFALIPDPGDREFAALASAAGVPVVTSDAHLLDHRADLDVPVMSPGELGRLLPGA